MPWCAGSGVFCRRGASCRQRPSRSGDFAVPAGLLVGAGPHIAVPVSGSVTLGRYPLYQILDRYRNPLMRVRVLHQPQQLVPV